ncbi:hypothetical protein ARMGADRAFT_323669 [Armillaria gallica]|uniref:Uncharacterized protein n=1 Tax=Armillaria gallica TaxID=47427 RepID=A0A2H3DDK3_ARMGA|nr:hypothetical protein ARMGADRAFT_323669 [Armillaria gallica]
MERRVYKHTCSVEFQHSASRLVGHISHQTYSWTTTFAPPRRIDIRRARRWEYLRKCGARRHPGTSCLNQEQRPHHWDDLCSGTSPASEVMARGAQDS